MRDDLTRIGAHVDDFRYCPHHPDAQLEEYRKTCSWRKPAPGMLQDLMARWPVDTARGFMLGAKVLDVEAAKAAGISDYRYTQGSLLELVQQATNVAPTSR